MRLIQKQENEILAIYEKWLDSYLSGDIDAYDSYFDDAYHFIGSTNNEEFLNRKDTTEFFRETTDQFAGKTDLRNDLKTVEKFGDIVFVTHLFDAWFMNGEDWNFYGRFRFSNALHETKEGWRFIYQHFSIPDAKAKEGDTIGFDQISAENLQLKDAIHRRTKELEEKSRELQIEGAMERVRSRTMAMQKSADLPEAANVLFNEIQKLGIPAWSAGYNILSEDRKSSICIMSSEGELQKPFVLPLTEHESFLPWYQAILNDEEFFVYGQEGEYLVSHYEYMKSLPELRSTFEQFEKAGLDLPTRQFNHLVRFNMGFLLFITYEEVPEAHKIFKRFGKVFEQTYTRFLDLQKAEVQAREAQIEAALERVRSRTMGMRHSSELQETAALLFDQIQALEINLMGCGFNIWNEDRSEATAWMSGLDRFQAPFQTSSSRDIFLRIYEAMKRGDKLFVEEQKGEELKAHYGYMASIPVFNRILKQLEEKGQSPPDFQMMHCAFFKHGYLMFITLEPATEAHEIFTRFAKVFDQTYTRFLDLKKAEKQARESEINLALERIRAATMAMHNTDEIGQTVVTFFQELRGLGLEESTRCGIGILSQAEHMQLYTASTKKGHKTKLTTGNLDMSIHPMLEGVKKAWENGEQSFSYELEGDDKFSYFEELNKVRDYPVNIDLDNLSEIVYHFSFPFKDGVLFVFLDNPLTEEYAEICKRFANSFSATYTRFLDLKKAEEQAREAQIELSLERIRAQATAMQESSDLLDIVVTMRSEFVKLGHEAHYFWHMRWLPEEYEKAMTSGDGTRIGMVMKLPRHIHGDINPVAEWEKSKEPTYVLAMDVEEAVQYVDKMITLGDFEKVDPQAPTLDDIRHIGGLTFIMARTTHGEIGYSLPGVVPDPPKDGVDALVRFAGVFDLAYKRFEDLKKAEARAREAQIEAALERVRSRSLAMHHSSELSSVVDKLLQEFTDLEFTLTFCIINLIDEQNRSNTVWAANPETGQDAESYYMKFEDYPFHHAMWEAWKDQKKRFVYTLEGEEKKNYDEYLYSETEFRRFPEHVKEANKALERYIAGFTFFKYSGLQTVSENPISEIDLEILERFGNVFEQAYTRFLDLQKAEDQARDSQIEAALERVRSRSMGMQKSKELEEVIKVVFDQLVQLDFKIDHAGFIIDYKENDDMHIWLTDKNSIPAEVTVPYIDTPHWNSFLEAKKNDENFFANLYTYEEKNKFYRELFELIPGVAEETKDYYQKCPGLAISTVLIGDIGLYIENFEGRPFSQEENETLSRFGKVFQQTYTRFRDLERAEEQAKEAQIEAALERVRSRSMGMQKSEELADLSLEMVRQVQELGVLTWFCAFNIYDEDGKGSLEWGSNGEGVFPEYRTPREGIFLKYYKAGLQGKKLLVHEIGEDECPAHYEYLCTLPGVGDQLLKMKEQGIPFPTSQIDHVAFFKYGYLLFITYEHVPESHEIFKRFARVFEQTYTRFLDLQKAEERAKEAQIETALEKVRSRTLAMQNSEEFAETSVVVFKQLLELGISPNRLFIGIIDPVGEVMDAWATNEDGTKLASKFQLKASENKSVSRMVDGWKQGKTSQVIDMMGEELKDYFQYLGMELRIPFQHGLDQKRRIQYLAYFSGGLIGMASGEAQNEQTLELLERFAAVFNLTYTRFKDLKVAEASAIKAEQDLEAIKAARENAEKALKELQQTQKQLIQSEKMASLGELTAGIAHEIQNPLNFVNNFSEVSNELLDEIFEEFENGNLDEVREILGDIKVNLDKINHHGKRADFIVKGMLQHSRKGNSQKESTNLNALCDEFLRLAYHGLRAKDKSFNASLETDFDPDLENIDIIAQDIGRVILNLLNNAFYAVLQKKNKIDETGYEPTVKISTRKKANHVQIKIEDNGDGIPDNILDKIFQPFFTTKPTGQGTGLGLSLSYDIVKAHGGDLEVTTQNGKGTTFTIIIKS